RTALDLAPLLIVDETELDGLAPDLKRVHADDRTRQVLAYVSVRPLDHRDHRHQKRDRHDDPEQREERAELVAPRGLERLEDGFGELHGAENVTTAGPGVRADGRWLTALSAVSRQLFVSQRFYRIEPRGPAGRVQPESDPREGGGTERDDYGPHGHVCRHRRDAGDGEREAAAH